MKDTFNIGDRVIAIDDCHFSRMLGTVIQSELLGVVGVMFDVGDSSELHNCGDSNLPERCGWIKPEFLVHAPKWGDYVEVLQSDGTWETMWCGGVTPNFFGEATILATKHGAGNKNLTTFLRYKPLEKAEEEVEELTLEQVCEQLGKTVKIIKG